MPQWDEPRMMPEDYPSAGPSRREATLTDMVSHQGRLIEELQNQVNELRNYVHDLAKRSDPAFLDEVLGRQVGHR